MKFVHENSVQNGSYAFPNELMRFRIEAKPIWKKIQNPEQGFQTFQIPDPRKYVFWPGDVFTCFVGPKNYRFVYRMENVPQTLSDTLYKFFL